MIGVCPVTMRKVASAERSARVTVIAPSQPLIRLVDGDEEVRAIGDTLIWFTSGLVQSSGG